MIDVTLLHQQVSMPTYICIIHKLYIYLYVYIYIYMYIHTYISHTYVRLHAQMHTYVPIYLPTCLAAIWPPSSYHQKAKEVLLTVIVLAPWDSLHNMHCIC